MAHRETDIVLLTPSGWTDYELLDSGHGAKLERFGPYVLKRPEAQALWQPSLSATSWNEADAVFERGDDGGGRWSTRRKLPDRWAMAYGGLTFWARLSPFRHTGVFPEQAAQWNWIRDLIENARRPVRVLDLFGYTALASLVAARAGACVTYVDASRPAMAWARENQASSGLQDRPIRWILDDALKFVRREIRRESRYEGIIMDPPVFGRGPRGEIWRFHEGFPPLVEACREVLSSEPLFFLANAYAIDVSSIALGNVLADALSPLGGTVTAGELALVQRAATSTGQRRLLPTGIFARWCKSVYSKS